jgi:hypothetical protein
LTAAIVAPSCSSTDNSSGGSKTAVVLVRTGILIMLVPVLSVQTRAGGGGDGKISFPKTCNSLVASQ